MYITKDLLAEMHKMADRLSGWQEGKVKSQRSKVKMGGLCKKPVYAYQIANIK